MTAEWPLGDDWRGLVVPCAAITDSRWEIEKQESERDGVPLLTLRSFEPTPEGERDPEELRGWLVLWDRIVMPLGEALIRQYPTRSFQFLQSAGVAEIFDVETRNDEIDLLWQELVVAHPQIPNGNLYRPAMSLAVFHEMERLTPGRWSIAADRDPLHKFIFTEPGRAILFKLHSAIPVPSLSTPLEDILEFRLRRAAERVALRHHLEQLYQSIITAGDGPLALRSQLEQLSSSIRDITAATKERGIKFQLAGIEARLKWEFAPFSGVTTAAAAAASGSLPAALVAMAAGILPRVEITTGAGLKGGCISSTPYEYALRIHRELRCRA